MSDKILPEKEQILKEMVRLTLCRDDFIEWILHSTNEDSEFRIYKSQSYISVGIDKTPFKP